MKNWWSVMLAGGKIPRELVVLMDWRVDWLVHNINNSAVDTGAKRRILYLMCQI